MTKSSKRLPWDNDETESVILVPGTAFDASGNIVAYDLDPSGATVIPETGKTARFFRLRAVEE